MRRRQFGPGNSLSRLSVCRSVAPSSLPLLSPGCRLSAPPGSVCLSVAPSSLLLAVCPSWHLSLGIMLGQLLIAMFFHCFDSLSQSTDQLLLHKKLGLHECKSLFKSKFPIRVRNVAVMGRPGDNQNYVQNYCNPKIYST